MCHEIFAGVYFCGMAIVCILRELILTIREDWFFLLELIFAIFRKYTQHPALIIFSFLLSTRESTCNRNTYFQAANQYFVVSE